MISQTETTTAVQDRGHAQTGGEAAEDAGTPPGDGAADGLDPRVEQACRKIEARLEGLRPYVIEFNLLRVALMGIESRLPSRSDQPRTRSEQAFAAIFLDPGLSTQEIADDTGIALSSLYPVLRGLEDQGLAHRIARCWYPGPRDPGSTSLLGLASP